MDKNTAFQKNLMVTFRSEAEERVKFVSSRLISLEKSPSDEKQTELVEEIFRALHNLKGAARAVNLTHVESLCHVMESIFSSVKQKDLALSSSLFDLLHDAVDTVGQLSLNVEEEIVEKDQSILNNLLWQLNSILVPQTSVTAQSAPVRKRGKKTSRTRAAPRQVIEPVPPQTQPVTQVPVPNKAVMLSDTIRISASRLDAVLLQAEGLLSVRLIGAENVMAIHEILSELIMLRKTQTKAALIKKNLQQTVTGLSADESKISSEKLKKLIELTTNDALFVQSIESKLAHVAKSVEQNHYDFSQMIHGVLENIKEVLMLPVASTLESFPKLIRDIAHDQGKKVDLSIVGAETQIDRRILHEMYDPLIHLVRNSIDHGIETPEIRKRKGKPPHGTITMTIRQTDGGHVEILVADDGAGIDTQKIRQKAHDMGIVAQDSAASDDDGSVWLPMIFQSGISTSPIITELSGRGLGLAIVWEKAEQLGGVVTVETQPDQGTTFHIVLPLTLATFRGVCVRVQEQNFILPTAQIEQCLRVKKEDIKYLENKATIFWRNETLVLVSLADVLEFPQVSDVTADNIPVLVLGTPGNRMAFSVDAILAEEEVLVKNFNKQLSRVRNVVGATVLGNGKAVPILHVGDLLRSAVNSARLPATTTARKSVKDIKKRKFVLVVEDSITSRTLLKNILESAGYSVITAVDGIDALMHLKMEAFDLVMSDVSMPRMNGFELTEKIRMDEKYKQLPVVLVTSLESREDRERGIDVGANAYIVKSSFNQSNLLDILQRLI